MESLSVDLNYKTLVVYKSSISYGLRIVANSLYLVQTVKLINYGDFALYLLQDYRQKWEYIQYIVKQKPFESIENNPVR